MGSKACNMNLGRGRGCTGTEGISTGFLNKLLETAGAEILIRKWLSVSYRYKHKSSWEPAACAGLPSR